jgi:uncharacterized protein (UPF0333 family)
MQYLILIILVILLFLNITISYLLIKIYDKLVDISKTTDETNQNISDLVDPMIGIKEKLKELLDNGI